MHLLNAANHLKAYMVAYPRIIMFIASVKMSNLPFIHQ